MYVGNCTLKEGHKRRFVSKMPNERQSRRRLRSQQSVMRMLKISKIVKSKSSKIIKIININNTISIDPTVRMDVETIAQNRGSKKAYDFKENPLNNHRTLSKLTK
ncbi:hypothetical protein RF11_14459 [Thelohanellus kitauei]|uniref:Uncharacterized protein n=1 Tax=Thelohanellus kitauei TaxID=669202 RepID=A0A0C2MQ28_THEKT|nr:hypothetical protein RF11_14459 [Thelohanellus kitauei]